MAEAKIYWWKCYGCGQAYRAPCKDTDDGDSQSVWLGPRCPYCHRTMFGVCEAEAATTVSVTSGYVLDSDDDGHWYVVPVAQRDAFSKWLASVDAEDFDPVGYPEGVVPLDGSPTRVVFPAFAVLP